MADSTKEAGAPRGDRLALAHPAAPRPALRPDALLHVGVGQVLAVDDHVGVVGGLQGEAAVADAAAVTLLFVHVHDVLQVLLPAAEGELRTGTRLTPRSAPHGVPRRWGSPAPQGMQRRPVGWTPAPPGPPASPGLPSTCLPPCPLPTPMGPDRCVASMHVHGGPALSSGLHAPGQRPLPTARVPLGTPSSRAWLLPRLRGQAEGKGHRPEGTRRRRVSTGSAARPCRDQSGDWL